MPTAFENLLGRAATPAEQAAYEHARAVYDRSEPHPCPFGACTVMVDPVTGKISGASGPVGCGCDNLPGWRSVHLAGLPKPGWNAKPVGRHGGRVAASRRKHADLATWQRELTRA